MARYHILILTCLIAGCGSQNAPRGWYVVGSNIEDKNALGGFGRSNNFPKKRGDLEIGAPGIISLIASPDQIADFNGKRCFFLRLINRTDNVAEFSACDSQLYIVEEVKSWADWRSLDKPPESFCGNSYHKVYLAPDEYWEMYAYPTSGRLRFRLQQSEENVIYSNEFTGN